MTSPPGMPRRDMGRGGTGRGDTGPATGEPGTAPRHGWTTTGSREVYGNPWIAVREDSVVRPGGGEGIYGVVTMRNPAVFVVALDGDDCVVMVSLYRYATRGMSLEVPAGGADDDDPLDAAQRELFEETGFRAREWREIGRMNALNGVCNAPEFVYLATELTREVSAEVEDEQAAEGIDAVRLMPWADVMRAVRTGEVSDGETVAALMFGALALGRL